ncbi:hypothetical protein PHMEG_0006213 [Phytophthora megakarya]|uniref:Uncharacterized protein n=1 Tax=Phytophthora megakarya TaxID=4795 RepID=A0A225WPI6_9STRA|nr:hypothetical protein PHMEG_0006213 [Phytophthora megakarya]
MRCIPPWLYQEGVTPDIVFGWCHSRWVENEEFPLQNVVEVVRELLKETNAKLR